MEDEREKPGPKSYPWHPDLGVVKNQGHLFPVQVHKLLRNEDTKVLLEKMALDHLNNNKDLNS
jgi:hypothetical protein